MMSPHNLQCYLQAMAIMIQVEGYKVANATRACDGMSPMYSEDHFEGAASEITEIMQAVSHES